MREHDRQRGQLLRQYQGLCASHAQTFDQTVLRRLETAFHAALGLWRVRSDPHDVWFPERSSDLRRWQRLALPNYSNERIAEN